MEAMHYRLLYDIARTLHQQNLDLDRTLQTIIRRTGDALQVSHGCLMTFVDAMTVDQIYIMGATDTPENRDRALWDTLLKRGVIGFTYHSKRYVMIRNIQTDPRWPTLPDVDFMPGTGSAIGIPLVQNDEIFGVLLLIHPEVDYFTEVRIEMLLEIGQMASSAVANARALRSAREGDTRYQALFEHTLVPIILTDGNGIVQDTNFKASEFLGYTRNQLRGVHLRDLNIPSVDRHGVSELQEDEETYFRTEIYDIDGREIPTLIRARRVRVEDRVVLEWMLQDLSAQMELEQLRRDLTAMVYHDLRGPLTNILAGIMSLSKVLNNHANPAVAKILTLSLRSTQQLQRLVDSLLDIQRLEDGRAILNRHAAEIRPMMLDVVQLVLPIAQEAGQTIEVEVAPNIPVTLLDTEMITRVMVNLVENAIKYTPNGGHIILKANQDNGELLITVKDSGPGIPEEARTMIFDKFSRIKYEDGPKGVGLGLAFCRLAVEAHHGRIWVDSDGVNGSEFKFSLPIHPVKEADAHHPDVKQRVAS